jgi:hypothetical protein
MDSGLALAPGVVERRHRRGLAEPVALEDHHAERVLEAAQHLDGQGRPARHAHPQLRRVVAVALGMVEQGVVHRRHALEDRDPVAIHQLQHSGGIEAGHEVQARAGAHGGVHRARLAEGVEQRQRAQHDVVLGEPGQADGRDVDVAAQVAVRQLRALRVPGRARRVEDDGGVAGRPLRKLARRLAGVEQALEPARRNDHHLRTRLACALLGGCAALVPGEQQLDA